MRISVNELMDLLNLSCEGGKEERTRALLAENNKLKKELDALEAAVIKRTIARVYNELKDSYPGAASVVARGHE